MSGSSVSERVAIVTAASKGIGAACARRLSADGWKVALMSRSDGAMEVADTIGGVAMRGSITQVDDLERLVATAMDRWGRLDAVVANCGHLPVGDLLELTDDDWRHGFDMVLLSVQRLARFAVPAMRRSGGGAMTCISGAAAKDVMEAFPISTVLRSGLGAWVRLAARAWAPEVRVNAVLPGFVDSYEVSDEILQQIPFDRSASVDEIASTVAWLSGAGSSYVTGESLRVDGGLTRSI
ncbi:MAG: SDR family oxidoreductase [Phycisphaerales bacterium]|nr:SDR family oxidoreductase [Phycisphaerales bacterium]